ncbi:unnamed protein product [Penicillium camemberti]|uniref:Str. FM013 n=1 Tax=Penicillium camemberti (strain FM 013) TaxID=1429867 RepID=A0A0G4P2H1_PENC3|nr:unnamed protein product [Penicillium camemberti]
MPEDLVMALLCSTPYIYASYGGHQAGRISAEALLADQAKAIFNTIHP